MNPVAAKREIFDYTQQQLNTSKAASINTSLCVPAKGKWAIVRAWCVFIKNVAADVGMDDLTTVGAGNFPKITVTGREVVLFPHQLGYDLTTEAQDATSQAYCIWVTGDWLFLPVYHTAQVKTWVPFAADDCLFFAEFGRYE